jgi:8-oxo-dGTP diphosphatase
MAKKKTKSKGSKSKGSTWNNSKGEIEFIARGVLIRDGQVLLCQSLKQNYFYLPGGHIEFGESAAQAMVRELKEELGVSVKAGELAMVSEGAFDTKRKHHEFNLMFHVEHPSPWPKALNKPKSKEDHIAFRWVPLAAVQDFDIRPTAVKAWLAAGLGDGGIEWVSEIQ